jgi:hypothetical protein
MPIHHMASRATHIVVAKGYTSLRVDWIDARLSKPISIPGRSSPVDSVGRRETTSCADPIDGCTRTRSIDVEPREAARQLAEQAASSKEGWR